MSEEMFVQHCSPTLAGIKTGNLFTCAFSGEKEMRESVRKFNKMLVSKGIRVLSLRYRNKRGLIYVYRPSKLFQDQEELNARELLDEFGYSGETPERRLAQLIQRLYENDTFPHEIGLFLGYPPEDVRGFIENKADGYKYSGEWDVLQWEMKC